MEEKQKRKEGIPEIMKSARLIINNLKLNYIKMAIIVFILTQGHFPLL